MEVGRTVYQRYCVVCHQQDGRGKDGVTGGDLQKRLDKSDDQLFESIRRGIDGGPVVMPAHDAVLSNDEIRATITYLKAKFGRDPS